MVTYQWEILTWRRLYIPLPSLILFHGLYNIPRYKLSLKFYRLNIYASQCILYYRMCGSSVLTVYWLVANHINGIIRWCDVKMGWCDHWSPVIDADKPNMFI